MLKKLPKPIEILWPVNMTYYGFACRPYARCVADLKNDAPDWVMAPLGNIKEEAPHVPIKVVGYGTGLLVQRTTKVCLAMRSVPWHKCPDWERIPNGWQAWIAKSRVPRSVQSRLRKYGFVFR